MKIIKSRFDSEVVRKIDLLVRRGVFNSRSDALRRITKEYLDRHPDLLSEKELPNWAEPDMDESELERICGLLFSGEATAAEIVREGR